MRVARLVWLLVLATACPLEEPVDARVFMEALMAATAACEDSFLVRAEPRFVEAQLAAQVETAIASFERNARNPQVEFSRPAYNACLSAARARDCATLQSDTGPCGSVFRGRADVEQTCAESAECAPGLSCFQERDQCGVCRNNAVEGDACADRNCASGAWCDQGTCAAEPTAAVYVEGDTCAPASGCGGLQTGLACVDLRCVPMLLVAEGEECDVGLGAVRYCVDSSSTHVCEGGACVARPTVGSACSTSGACDATAGACVDGQCVDGGRPGDTCGNAYGCRLGARCTGGVCASLSDVPTPPTCG